LNHSQIVVYENGEVEIEVSFDNQNETIWLTQKQIAALFDKDVRTINDHIKTIYKDQELVENSTIRKFRIVQKEGNREVAREVKHYNLDMIISVGYRVNSIKATKFRQWATKVLKQYIVNGYAINSEKITVDRFINLENDVISLQKDMKKVKNIIKDNQIELIQGIFYNGQIFDAYTFVNDLLKSAKKRDCFDR